MRNSLFSGIIWNSIEKVLLKGVSLIISIVLARLLSPSDYGLLGMLSIFMTLSHTFIDSGFARALIQKKDCEEIDYSTAFVTNVSVSLVFYAILFFCAPLIAAFYDEPILIPLTRVVSLNFVIGSFNMVQRARLQSKVDFKSLAKVNVIASLVSGVVGISLAFLGWGVWALVMQHLFTVIVPFFILPYFSKWRPSLKFSKASFRGLWSFGSKLLATGTVSVIVSEISTICIGKVYKSNQLGFFTKAKGFPQMVSDVTHQVIGSVTFPVLSGIQDEKEHFVSVYKKGLYYMALIIFPLMILLAILAKPLVLVLLTEKWLGCVAMMQWFFLARMFYPLSALNMNVLNAAGRSDLFMKVDFSTIPLTIIMLAITIPIGVEAMVIGMFVNSFICYFVYAYMPGKLWGYGAWQQIKDWKWIFLSIIIMSIMVGLFTFIIENIYLQLFGGITIGVVSYFLCCKLFKLVEPDVLDGVLSKLKIKKARNK